MALSASAVSAPRRVRHAYSRTTPSIYHWTPPSSNLESSAELPAAVCGPTAKSDVCRCWLESDKIIRIRILVGSG